MKRKIWTTLALITLGFAVLMLGPRILALIPLALVIAAGWLVFAFVSSAINRRPYRPLQLTSADADQAARRRCNSEADDEGFNPVENGDGDRFRNSIACPDDIHYEC